MMNHYRLKLQTGPCYANSIGQTVKDLNLDDMGSDSIIGTEHIYVIVRGEDQYHAFNRLDLAYQQLTGYWMPVIGAPVLIGIQDRTFS